MPETVLISFRHCYCYTNVLILAVVVNLSDGEIIFIAKVTQLLSTVSKLKGGERMDDGGWVREEGRGRGGKIRGCDVIVVVGGGSDGVSVPRHVYSLTDRGPIHSSNIIHPRLQPPFPIIPHVFVHLLCRIFRTSTNRESIR